MSFRNAELSKVVSDAIREYTGDTPLPPWQQAKAMLAMKQAMISMARLMKDMPKPPEGEPSDSAKEAAAEASKDLLVPVMEAFGDALDSETPFNARAIGKDLAQAFATVMRTMLEAAKQTPARKTRPLPATILYHSGPITRAAVEAISHAQGMAEQAGLAHAYQVARKNGSITVGIPGGPTASDVWEYLCKSGAAAVKMHYALWANFYEQTDGRAAWVTVDVAQLCRHMGYKPHHKGGFKRETKMAVAEAAKAMFAVEVRAVLMKPGPNGKPGKEMRLSGPLWTRGMEAEQRDISADLFGWEPVALSYQPGQWFTAEYQQAHQYVGKAAAALMDLRTDRDEWAILMGAYLIPLARTNGYAPKRVRMETVLARANLAQDQDGKRRKTETRKRAEAAMDRLAEVGVIQSWCYTDGDVEDLEDWDDAAALEAYYADSAPIPKDDWRGKVLLIEWPPERRADQKRLTRGKAAGVKRAARKKKPAA